MNMDKYCVEVYTFMVRVCTTTCVNNTYINIGIKIMMAYYTQNVLEVINEYITR